MEKIFKKDKTIENITRRIKNMKEHDYKVKVDEDNKVVVISKKNIDYDIIDMLSNRGIYHYNDKLAYMPSKITVKARCCPEDTFNKETGINIAKDRFKAKYRANAIKVLDRIIDSMYKDIRELEAVKTKFKD